uniref:Uncharacterized protein n=1 Tax=Branchiostoma floridae TaxID=7739 RepID=C3ZK24_BRAFL|eukprot:XP_002591111.1 hypothetical protein BRAFLDRAFT_108720 [Branchiostoma floridae]
MTRMFQMFAFVVVHSSFVGAHAARDGTARHAIRHANGAIHAAGDGTAGHTIRHANGATHAAGDGTARYAIRHANGATHAARDGTAGHVIRHANGATHAAGDGTAGHVIRHANGATHAAGDGTAGHAIRHANGAIHAAGDGTAGHTIRHANGAIHAAGDGTAGHTILHANGAIHGRQKMLTISVPNATQAAQKPAKNEGLFSTQFYATTSKAMGQSHTLFNSADKISSQFCPTFCCHLNISCFYNTQHRADYACVDGSPSRDVTCDITQSAPSERKKYWKRVMHMRTPITSVCVSETLNNQTDYKLHCHIRDIQDFTYSIGGVYNRSAWYPGHESVWGRPCLVFIHVNTTYPELEPVIDKAMAYIGIIALVGFVGFICVLARHRDGDK